MLYLIVARDAPECPPAKPLSAYLAVLKDRDAWWFMFFYAVTFGGSFVRPVGGFIADRIGGIRTLTLMYVSAAAWLFIAE